MDKKLEDMTPEEIDIQAKLNYDNWMKIMDKIELASKSIGITKEQGIHFLDVLNGSLNKVV